MIENTDEQHTVKRTTVAGGIIIALLLLLTAGTVAAVYLMQSQTDVSENTIDNQYIVISTTTYTDFLNGAVFDTVNDNGSVTYTLHTDTDLDGASGNEAALISNAMSINVAPTNVSGTFDLFVSVTSFTPVSGITYTMKVANQTATYDTGASGYGWYFQGLALDTDLDTALYVSESSGPLATAPGATLGFTNYVDAGAPGSVFTFLASIPDA